ncbi:MAG: F0F1 ATP synthase subunit A [Vicinamibacteria bacterium]|nr:F0F1 ATP synthase subunit A [Vicinamibacteria bacterium]
MKSLPFFVSAAGQAAASHAVEEHAAAGQNPAAVIMHHASDHAIWGLPSRHLAFFALAALLVIFIVRLAMRGYRKGIPHGLAAFVEMLVLFVRDEIAEKNIGHDSRKFTPLLCSFFFFILVAAFLGLMPFAATSTGNIAVTMALATVSFFAQQYAGISRFGLAGHFKNLIPAGLPFWMLPVMIPIEILGLFTKPFALMVRLFANMLAGHIVITTLLVLIPMMARTSALFGAAIAPVSLGLSLFIMLLEILVAFIQAFIFTLLSAIFIGMFAHPAH